MKTKHKSKNKNKNKKLKDFLKNPPPRKKRAKKVKLGKPTRIKKT